MARSKMDTLAQDFAARQKTVVAIKDIALAAGVETTDIKELDLTFVQPDPNQPRKYFDPASLKELAASIEKNGLLQPIGVRRDPAKPGYYIIIMGERRWQASGLAGQSTIKAIVMEKVDAAQARILALLENLQRDDLTPEEEASAFRQLKDAGASQKEIAATIHKNEGYVSKRLEVFGDATLAKMVRDGTPVSYAEEIIRVKQPALREKLVQAVRGGIGLPEVRKRVNSYNQSLNPDDLDLPNPPRNRQEGKTDKQAVHDAISALMRVEHNLRDASTITQTDAKEIARLCRAVLDIVE